MRKGYGFFGYFDPDHKRVFVPKENPSMGWTINYRVECERGWSEDDKRKLRAHGVPSRSSFSTPTMLPAWVPKATTRFYPFFLFCTSEVDGQRLALWGSSFSGGRVRHRR